MSADDASLAWTQYDSWGTGSCYELTVTNNGDDLSDWTAEVTLDQDVTLVTWTDGAAFDFNGSTITLTPSDTGTLANGSSVTAYTCIEPLAEPISLGFTGTVDDTTDDTTDTGSDDTGQVDLDPFLDAQQDDSETLLVYWSQDGEYDGDAVCHDLQITNLTAADVDTWALELQFDATTTLQSLSGAFVFLQTEARRFDVVPVGAATTLSSYETAEAEVCFSEAVRLSDVELDEDATTTTSDLTISGVVASLTDADTVLRVVFTTSELASARVCNSNAECWYSTSTGTTHVVQATYSAAETYTIEATDSDGSTVTQSVAP